MDLVVFFAVLAAAAFHAGWNAVIKGGGDPLTVTALVAIAAGVVALPLLPVVGLPSAAAWPWVIASVIVHLFYFGGLIEAYRHGDLSQIYPIARGSAPLLTASISTTLLGERLGVIGWVGLLLLVLGVFLLSLRGSNDLARFNKWGVGFALFAALTICAYTLIDGIGARVSGNAPAYTVALFIGSSLIMLAYAVARSGTGVFAAARTSWGVAAIGGGLQLASYGIAIWAMTVAPIAIIAALRETSVLFGALIAVAVLKEKMRASRVVAALLIVGGLTLLRLS